MTPEPHSMELQLSGHSLRGIFISMAKAASALASEHHPSSVPLLPESKR